MRPFGRALLAYHRGESSAELIIRRDDGLEVALPVGHFFRSRDEFSPGERLALERCSGRVLDLGAGSGLHSLELLRRGREVTAIDISPDAVRVMIDRGVPDARQADAFRFREGPFDTLLMLGHGIGAVGDLTRLRVFLEHARRLTHGSGQLLLDSLDVRATDDPRHLSYQEANREAGRYFGSTRLQFAYDGQVGPYCGWLHVDPESLRRQGALSGWTCEVLCEQTGGEYLARLVPE